MLEATAQPLVRTITNMLPDIWLTCAYVWHKRAQALARRSRRPTAGCPALAVRTACIKQSMSSCCPSLLASKPLGFFRRSCGCQQLRLSAITATAVVHHQNPCQALATRLGPMCMTLNNGASTPPSEYGTLKPHTKKDTCAQPPGSAAKPFSAHPVA